MTNPFLQGGAAPQTAPPAAPAATAPPQAPPQAPPAAPATGGTPMAGRDPFAGPSAAAGAKVSDDLNQGLVFRPTEYIAEMNTSQGKTDAVRADWVVLTGENMGEVRSGSLVFQTALKSDLRKLIGTPTPFLVAVLRRHTEGKGGNSPAYYFETADENITALARQAAQANNWI